MNENSLLVALKARLQAATWSGGSTIFGAGAVAVTANVELATVQMVKYGRVPSCLIQPATSQSDPEFNEEPDLVKLSLLVRIIVMVSGDAFGENALMGANKSGGSTASEGRGITEIEQELYSEMGKLNDLEDYILQVTQKGEAGFAYIEGGKAVAWRDTEFDSWVTMV